jgi:dTDP-4-amino-4,6-dideoxygalactose transaminase
MVMTDNLIPNDKPTTPLIPHSRPTLGPEEIRRVSEVLESGQLAQGQMVAEFEAAFARKLEVGHAVCVSSGTAALHLSLLALKIRPKDEVIIPSYVCSALLNAVNYVGARPVLAEIDPHTHNLDCADVKKRLTRRTRAIIVPHLFGLAADLGGLSGLDVPIIEDCAQAAGASYRQRPVGTLGRAAIFSFYATKVLTTGEGGMIVSDSEALIQHARNHRQYDKTDGYQTRFNYKMTDIQAAIGLCQLNRLDDFINRRRVIAQNYHNALASLDIQLPPKRSGHIYFRYVIRLHANARPWLRSLKAKGVGCARPVHTPVHRYLRRDGYPITDKAWDQSISIPIYPSLTEEESAHIIHSLIETGQEVSGANNC